MSAAAGAAIAAAIANAVKASGAVVRVQPEDFAKILSRVEKPLVIYKYRRFLQNQTPIPGQLQRLCLLYQNLKSDRSSEVGRGDHRKECLDSFVIAEINE